MELASRVVQGEGSARGLLGGTRVRGVLAPRLPRVCRHQQAEGNMCPSSQAGGTGEQEAPGLFMRASNVENQLD